MGNYQITIEGTGPHHNRQAFDAEVIAAATVAELAKNGHHVSHATVHAGGGKIDLLERPRPAALQIGTMPRRWIAGELTPVEVAIRDAMAAVEAAGASPALTAATEALGQAFNSVADHVEANLPAPAAAE
jgi:hypothetical protein